MSGSRWVTTLLWSSGSLTLSLYSSCVYPCHLFFHLFYFLSVLMVSVLIISILAWNVPVISPIFLKRSLVFPFVLFSSILLHCLYKKAFLSLLAILWKSAFSWVYLSFSQLLLLFFFPQLFVKPAKTTSPHSCISSSLGWFCSLPPVVLQTSVLSSPKDTFSNRLNTLDLFVTSTI